MTTLGKYQVGNWNEICNLQERSRLEVQDLESKAWRDGSYRESGRSCLGCVCGGGRGGIWAENVTVSGID